MALTELCGFECRIITAGAAPVPDEKHWDQVLATMAISTTTVRSGTASLQSAVAASYLGKTVARTIVSGRVYIRFATLPSAETIIVQHVNANGSASIRVANTGVLRLFMSTVASATIATLVTGTWYRVDWVADSSGATATIKATVDGAGEQTASNAQVSANFTAVRFGSQTAAVTLDMFFDDLLLGNALVDYPFGAGTVERMKPTRDGTHSFTAGDFRYGAAGSNILTSATDVNTYVDDDNLEDITDFIAQRVIRTTGYVEVGFGTAPFTHDALAVMVVSSWHASTTGANTVGLKMNDGGTILALTDDAGDDLSDFSNTTFTQHELVRVTPPSGGTWTKAKIDALLIRMGYSGDVIGEPYWDGVMLEVAYTPQRVPYVNPMPQLLAH